MTVPAFCLSVLRLALLKNQSCTSSWELLKPSSFNYSGNISILSSTSCIVSIKSSSLIDAAESINYNNESVASINEEDLIETMQEVDDKIEMFPE